jgi:nicotinamidase-related amidase
MILPNLTLQNSALLVIDVINSCAHHAYEDPSRNIHYQKVRLMVPALASFITSYKQLGGRVILTSTVPWQEPFLPENINELYRNNTKARYWSQDSSGRAEQFYGLPTEGALVIVKNSYDAFTNRDLLNSLEELHIRYILIAGVFGDGCVMASICGGFSKGYHMIIVDDLIETTDDEDRQAFQQYLKKRLWPLMYGTTLKSQELLTAFTKEVLE